MTQTHSQPGPATGAQEGEEYRLPKLAELPSFAEYMSQGWDTPDRTPPVVPGAADAAAAHRKRLAAELPGRPVVAAAGRAPVRCNDTSYDFRPDSNFCWLTGCPGVEDAVTVLDGDTAVLYIPPPAYPGDPQFFSNAAHGELWVGAAPRGLPGGADGPGHGADRRAWAVLPRARPHGAAGAARDRRTDRG